MCVQRHFSTLMDYIKWYYPSVLKPLTKLVHLKKIYPALAGLAHWINEHWPMAHVPE